MLSYQRPPGVKSAVYSAHRKALILHVSSISTPAAVTAHLRSDLVI